MVRIGAIWQQTCNSLAPAIAQLANWLQFCMIDSTSMSILHHFFGFFPKFEEFAP
jgi:hypothetical protein